MDTVTIVLLLLAVVVFSIIIVVISQLRERARIERARRVAALEDAYNRARRIYDELPGQYLTRDTKLLLLRRMEELCQRLVEERADLPLRDWANSVREQKQKVMDGTDEHPKVIIDSPDKSNYIKDLLQSLFKLIESLHKSGKINSSTARAELRHVLFTIHKTHADLFVFQARDHVRQNQLRKAIHAYHLAATEMAKSKGNDMAAKAVASFKARIRDLEAELASGQSTRSAEQQGRLDKEWDTFLHDDNWKKKADYD
ncbi:hypothetical protein SAMN05216203_0773 [Marinobacter daqiaonensis]|uniref:Uncharacterized protein n=1 Tax=Marinobacter daqiaonensis TaxID=650891 RepID=A0A1I6H2B9_9GAMM|nr:hypothetical protein [Marinobacter daqiaonensis]SFR48564.1 hypothetical protein SAMN05216203_0773 [Marinobacter daqiaonensis]